MKGLKPKQEAAHLPEVSCHLLCHSTLYTLWPSLSLGTRASVEAVTTSPSCYRGRCHREVVPQVREQEGEEV